MAKENEWTEITRAREGGNRAYALNAPQVCIDFVLCFLFYIMFINFKDDSSLYVSVPPCLVHCLSLGLLLVVFWVRTGGSAAVARNVSRNCSCYCSAYPHITHLPVLFLSPKEERHSRPCSPSRCGSRRELFSARSKRTPFPEWRWTTRIQIFPHIS